MAGIGYENAKQILKVYKKEGRKFTLLFKNKDKKVENDGDSDQDESEELNHVKKKVQKKAFTPKSKTYTDLGKKGLIESIKAHLARSHLAVQLSDDPKDVKLPPCPVHIFHIPSIRRYEVIQAQKNPLLF